MIEQPLHNPKECLHNLQTEFFNPYLRTYVLLSINEGLIKQTHTYKCCIV
jgi:hypothetical protein